MGPKESNLFFFVVGKKDKEKHEAGKDFFFFFWTKKRPFKNIVNYLTLYKEFKEKLINYFKKKKKKVHALGFLCQTFLVHMITIKIYSSTFFCPSDHNILNQDLIPLNYKGR